MEIFSGEEELLSNRYTLGLLINVDWFQPYKHIEYSVGAIYITILNFPHLQENSIVVGIIPGPREPKLHMNSYLEPLVSDLLKLWKGVQMATQQLIRAVLLCAASCSCEQKIGWICRPCSIERLFPLSRIICYKAIW